MTLVGALLLLSSLAFVGFNTLEGSTVSISQTPVLWGYLGSLVGGILVGFGRTREKGLEGTDETDSLLVSGSDRCPNPGCGQPLNPLEQFCTACGFEILGKQPEGIVCTNPDCSAPLTVGQKFCTNCGTHVEASVVQEAEEAVRRCPNQACGAVVHEGQKFCTACGTQLK